MKCHKCNSENSDTAKFCHKCGAELGASTEPKKSFLEGKGLIILVIAVVAILAVAVAGYAVFIGSQPNLQTKDFGGFSISVPEGSDFVLKTNITNIPGKLYVGYVNAGKWNTEAYSISISESKTVPTSTGEQVESSGNQKIFANKTSSGTIYTLYEDKGSCAIMLIGSNLNLLKEMSKTFQLKSLDALKGPTTATQTTSTPVVSGPISILGGSFSTGSGDADKTYAKINVGTGHAGESYTVQIFYSRDGKALNNGNMVPVSVHGDGCIYVSSADAYKFYPDHATIKIYSTSGQLLATKSVTLTPTSGTQTF